MMNENARHMLTVHRMTFLAIEEAIIKGEGPVEALRWALEYGKRFDLKESEVAEYLLTTPEQFVQQCRKEKETEDE